MHSRTAIGLTAAVLAIAGCGASADYANKPRPPAPINVTAAISQGKITVSPKTFGAGPIVMIIANETDQAHRVTLETDELGASRPGLKQSTGPINPQGTTTLKVDMPSGAYQVSVDSGRSIRSARLKVGAQRPSAQNDLLQP
jgi:hypothetical protein